MATDIDIGTHIYTDTGSDSDMNMKTFCWDVVVASLHPLFSEKGAIIAPRLSRLWLKLVSREIMILGIIAFYHEERL